MNPAYTQSLNELIEQFGKLPGIGPKTAERLAFHILKANSEEAMALAEAVRDVKQNIRQCKICYNLSEEDLCGICTDNRREKHIICVVEQPSDLVALEKSGAFKGVYHVLHGALSPINGIGPDELKIKELIARVADGQIQELVLATNTSVEGEATASYLVQRLKSLPARVTRIASGIPMGSDLKYLDEVTIKRAMERRQDF